MTETSTAATQHRRGLQVRVGRQAVPGVEIKIAEDGEVLLKGPNIFRGYYKNDEATARRSSTAGSTPVTSGGSTRTASSTSPAARRTSSSRPGGKNITPANLENGLKQNQYISQAVVHGDRGRS